MLGNAWEIKTERPKERQKERKQTSSDMTDRSYTQTRRAGNTLAVGTHSAEIQLWDVSANTMTRSMRGHVSRVASLSWGQLSCPLRSSLAPLPLPLPALSCVSSRPLSGHKGVYSSELKCVQAEGEAN